MLQYLSPLICRVILIIYEQMDLFDQSHKWDYEVGFYNTSGVNRIGKLIAHYELYKRVVSLPGSIVEGGVYKGSSLIRFASFRELLENAYSRKIIGFDAFGKFPVDGIELTDDLEFIERFQNEGGNGYSIEQIKRILKYKAIENVDLVQGDIRETVPEYVKNNPALRISFLHIDVDVYEASTIMLEHLFERVVKGGLIVLDDYAKVAGETRAVDEFMKDRDLELQKLPLFEAPSFIVK